MKKAIVLFTLGCSLLSTLLFSSSLQLTNDSTFPLIAYIFDAQGNLEDSIRLQPGQTYMWYRNDSSFKGQMDQPYTPFTIRWVCNTSRPYDYNPPPKKKDEKRQQYQSEFASWTNVPTGALVSALGCPAGTKTCVVRKKQSEADQPDQKRPKSQQQQRQSQKDANAGFNNWSNDGGQNWSNDGGPGWEDNDGVPLEESDYTHPVETD